ncbi:hypothetical protein CDG81_21510 [Actinopolyspora erythraea]|uniref:Carrier domain-containing protein n=1 Tax=Actinopolyspora erythraea TaxID=414996 RepID=A0A223RXE3_9ACTN|nr:non-ribosomal peptide synthetase [Actinopolyspora erythraea]ASU80419.1 hypothetical protein CDG81_21510 [Actinopolyspora erythraea]
MNNTASGEIEMDSSEEAALGSGSVSLFHTIAERASRFPEAVAVQTDERVITYRELMSTTERIARLLRTNDVGPDVLVGVSMRRCPELVSSLLAVVRSGGGYVPLDPSYPDSRIRGMIDDARPAVLLVGPGGVSPGELDMPEEEAPTVVDVTAPADVTEFDGYEEPSSGDALYVMYTSGSTGSPKGVVNTRGAVTELLRRMSRRFPLDTESRVLLKTPFGFDVSAWEIFWPLMSGARLVLAHPEGQHDPAHLVRKIREHGVTDAIFVPTQLTAFLDEQDDTRCPTLRRVFLVGEDLAPELLRRCHEALPGASVINAYGPTEAAIVTIDHTCRESDASGRRVPVGRPVARTEAHVLDAATLRPVPRGTEGELFLAGPQLARGYLHRPAMTAERFLPNPHGPPGSRLYRTGDLARVREDGTIEFLGRDDRQVKVRGNRVELGDVEASLRRLPMVGDAEAAVRTDPADGTNTLVAWVTAASGEATTATAIRGALLELVPRYMVPSHLVVLDAFPMLPNGKLDRSELPEPFGGTASSEATAESAPEHHERTVMRVWGELLEVSEIGRDDGFFELGGNSMLLLRIRTRLQQQGYQGIRLLDLLEHPTPRGLAEFLRGRDQRQDAEL